MTWIDGKYWKILINILSGSYIYSTGLGDFQYVCKSYFKILQELQMNYLNILNNFMLSLCKSEIQFNTKNRKNIFSLPLAYCRITNHIKLFVYNLISFLVLFLLCFLLLFSSVYVLAFFLYLYISSS